MTALVVGVLVASLLGSVHCAGMCGPLVAVYAGLPTGDATWRRRAMGHAAYSGGRLAVYAALGALAGALGAAVDRAGSLAGVARAAAIVSGLLIVGSGVQALLSAWGVGARHAASPFSRRLLGGLVRAAARRSAWARAAWLGAGTALLPCGWLYAFVVTAGGTGTPLRGALVMAAFWTGTLPIMVAFGEAIRLLAAPVRRQIPTVCAIVLIVLGLVTVFGRSRSAGALSADAATPPCHGTR